MCVCVCVCVCVGGFVAAHSEPIDRTSEHFMFCVFVCVDVDGCISVEIIR